MGAGPGGGVLFAGLLVVVVTSLVCSAVATDVDIELIDEGYDFIPNMVRAPRPEAASNTRPKGATTRRPRKNRLRAHSKAQPGSNPLDRFVSAIVSHKANVREKRRLEHVSEQFAKSKAADKKREQAQAAQLAAQRQQALQLKKKLADLRTKEQAAQVKEHKDAALRAAKAEHAALAKASEKEHKMAETVKLPPSAPLARGQGAAVNSVKATRLQVSGPPPLDGLSDGTGNPSRQVHTVRTEDTNFQYDVAKAEANVEQSENRLLAEATREYELGQSLQGQSGAHADRQPQAMHAGRSEVFLKEDFVEQSRTAKAKSFGLDESLQEQSLFLLDVPAAAGVSEMKTLAAELSKTAHRKSGDLATIQQKFPHLVRQLSKVRADQRLVTRKSLELGGHASAMLSAELGETHADQHEGEDLGEGASSDGSGLDALAAQMSKIDSDVSQLGDEEHTLDKSAEKRAAEKKTKVAEQQMAARKQRKIQETSHKYKVKQMHMQEEAKHQDANLLAQEARLRMTTVAQVEAESHLAAALAAKRKHEAMRLKNTKPVTKMSSYDVNREMYKRMYLQNAEEQATQAKVDLQNKLTDVREADEQHLKEALLRIKDHKAGVKAALRDAYKLRESVEEDEELGESLENTQPSQIVKQLQKTQQHAMVLERQVANDAKVLMNKVQGVQAYNEGVAGLAHNILKDVPNTPDITLQADIGSSSMKLQLQLEHLKQVDSKANKMAAALRAVQTVVEHASIHERIAHQHLTQVAHVLHRVNHGVARETSTLELSSTKLRRSQAEEEFDESNQSEEVELGESGESTPITAQQNWESNQLAKAQSDLEQIHMDTPSLIKHQVAVDKTHLSKIMGAAQKDLESEENKFHSVANSISPTLKNNQLLQEAINREQDRKDRYAQQLAFVARRVKLVSEAERKATHDINSAIDRIREQAQ